MFVCNAKVHHISEIKTECAIRELAIEAVFLCVCFSARADGGGKQDECVSDHMCE